MSDQRISDDQAPTVEMTHELALILLRSGQMPPSRFIELAREHGWPE